MSIVGAAFKGLKTAAKSPGKTLFQGGVGSLAVAGTGFSLYASHQMYASKYGAGAAFAIGAAEAGFFLLPPALSLPAAGMYYGATSAYDYGKETYRENRKLNMGQPVNDRFGTMATMRQRSSAALQRGRAVLGSEARLYHY